VNSLPPVGVHLVNSLPPVGCTPWRSRLSGYARCDGRGNAMAGMHNALLGQKLGDLDGVLLLDLYTAFNSVAQSKSGTYTQLL